MIGQTRLLLRCYGHHWHATLRRGARTIEAVADSPGEAITAVVMEARRYV